MSFDIRFVYKLLILALSCSLRLLLALYAGLFVAFSLAELCQGPRACDLTLKATECAVQRLAFLDSNFCHFLSLPPLVQQ